MAEYKRCMKWPRQYAAEIVALRTQAERKAALAQVPAHLREWVAELVHDAWSRRHDRRPQRARAQRDPARDP